MTNRPETDEQNIHIMHDGKFSFSIFEGRHPSWCHLKILQGKTKILIILSQPCGYVGTFIPTASEELGTQILNLFSLDPATTTFVCYTPPSVSIPVEAVDDDDKAFYALAKTLDFMHGPSDDKYEIIRFEWIPATADEPVLERYRAREFPYWYKILPMDVAKLLEGLNT